MACSALQTLLILSNCWFGRSPLRPWSKTGEKEEGGSFVSHLEKIRRGMPVPMPGSSQRSGEPKKRAADKLSRPSRFLELRFRSVWVSLKGSAGCGFMKEAVAPPQLVPALTHRSVRTGRAKSPEEVRCHSPA